MSGRVGEASANRAAGRGAAEHGVIAVGANLGDRRATIAQAVRELADTEGVEVTGISQFIESVALRPHGRDTDAPAYLNGVVTITTTLDPQQLLERLHEIEHAHGRVRVEHWGDRTLDLDIVDLGGRQQHDERLTLPHPRAHERDFVLAPWLQLDPEAVLTGHGRVDALLARLETAPGDAETAADTGAADDTDTDEPGNDR